MPQIPLGQVWQFAQNAGFTGDGLNTIVAISQAESALYSDAKHLVTDIPTDDPAYGSTDRGILQLNSYWHPEIVDSCAYDPACAFQSAFKISNYGTDFSQWTTYQNGAYKQFLQNGSNSVVNLVASYVQTSQFEANETEFACGPFTVSLNKFAGLPGKSPSGTSEDVDKWADAEYAKLFGNYSASNTSGVSIENMHTLLHDASLHYWDIGAINANSQQSSDINAIKRALEAYYPVVATITEVSVYDLDLQANPYGWGPSGNHIITYVGIADDGNLLAVDPANVVGQLQGPNQVRQWPRRYDITKLDNSWASVVQLVGPDASNPWLKPIPSGDPTTWPQGFDARNYTGGAIDVDPVLQAVWDSTNTGAPFTTGIAQDWASQYKNHATVYGPPLGKEFETTTLDGHTKIVKQIFAYGWCEDNNGKHTWFGPGIKF